MSYNGNDSNRKDLYKILEITPESSEEVIKAAYKALAKKYHPDVVGTTVSAQKMQEVNEAYGILSDKSKRAEYDRFYHYSHNTNTASAGISREEADILRKKLQMAEERARQMDFKRQAAEQRANSEAERAKRAENIATHETALRKQAQEETKREAARANYAWEKINNAKQEYQDAAERAKQAENRAAYESNLRKQAEELSQKNAARARYAEEKISSANMAAQSAEARAREAEKFATQESVLRKKAEERIQKERAKEQKKTNKQNKHKENTSETQRSKGVFWRLLCYGSVVCIGIMLIHISSCDPSQNPEVHECVVEDEWVCLREPTCLDSGVMCRRCAICGKVMEEKEGVPLGHTFGEWKEEQKASCSQEGIKVHYCDRCGVAEQQTAPALGHKMGEWIVDKDATTEQTGKRHRSCVVCGKVLVTEDIPIIGHTCLFGEWSIIEEAGCTTFGQKQRSCQTCGITQTEIIPAVGHTAGEWEIETEAAYCIQTGTRMQRCAVCGAIISIESFVGTEHQLGEWRIKQEATCTEEGKAYQECLFCHAILSERTISIIDHNWGEWQVSADATCTEQGYEQRTCSMCGNAETRATEKLTHTPSDWIIDKEALCVSDGERHIECVVCHTKLATDTIPPLGHEPREWIIDIVATCTSLGKKHCVCNRCGNSVNEEIIPKTEHDWAATAIYPSKIITCWVCGEGKCIIFGSYPQSRVKDSGLIDALNSLAGELPEEGQSSCGIWNSYGYYSKDVVSHYMWYADLNYQGNKYRGVYFVKYRPRHTHLEAIATLESSAGIVNPSNQDENGYYVNIVYWFKWEALNWYDKSGKSGDTYITTKIIDTYEYHEPDASNPTKKFTGSALEKWMKEDFEKMANISYTQICAPTELVTQITSATDYAKAQGWDGKYYWSSKGETDSTLLGSRVKNVLVYGIDGRQAGITSWGETSFGVVVEAVIPQ